MTKKYEWRPGETKEQLIKRLFPEYEYSNKGRNKRSLPFSIEPRNRRKNVVLTPKHSKDFKTLDLIEDALNRGLSLVLNPEWGEELSFAVRNNEFIELKSLEIFLLHCPLSRGFWNNFKQIYKLLEQRLLVLSERRNYEGKEAEVDVITKSLAIIFYRLENRARCDECNKFCMKSRSSEIHCTQPCETWTGGIRYTQNYINLNGQRIDSLKLRTEIIASHEGIRNVEIFKSRSIDNENHQEKLTALILHSDNFDRIKFELYLKKAYDKIRGRDYEWREPDPDEEKEKEAVHLPEIVHYFSYRDYLNESPWASRGLSTSGKRMFSDGKKFEEIYADLRPFIPTEGPSLKTVKYMRRRFRRLLRNLRATEEYLGTDAPYFKLCLEFFKLQDYFQKDAISEQWLLTEILFGNDYVSKRNPEGIKQRGHGRGNISFPGKYINSRNYRSATPAFRLWESFATNNVSIILKLIKGGKLPLVVTEFLVSISFPPWHAAELEFFKHCSLKLKSLNRILQSSSKPLVSFAFKFLEHHPETIQKVRPASIARGLAILDLEEISHYFDCLLTKQLDSLPKNWKARFSYELDDAIASQQPDLLSKPLTNKTLHLGLLSLQLPWRGRLKDPILRLAEQDPIFSWKSDRLFSVWGKSNWLRPNTYALGFGFIGWDYSIFQKALYNLKHDFVKDSHDYVLQNELVGYEKLFGHHFSLSDTERLLSLLKIQSSYLLCNNCRTNTYSDLRIEECSSCNQRSTFQLTKGLATQILKPYDWLRKEILIALLNRQRDLKDQGLSDQIDALINQELTSTDSSIFEEVLFGDDFNLTHRQLADMLCQISDEKWDSKVNGGELVPEKLQNDHSFWSCLWEKISENENSDFRAVTYQRFFGNPILKHRIFTIFAPKNFEQLSEEQAQFILELFNERIDLFDFKGSLLLKAATCSDSRINEEAYKLLANLEMESNFSLSLLESGFPRAVEEATNFYSSLDPNDVKFLDEILSLCDSSHSAVRSLGIELLETHKDKVSLARVIVSLKENRHPDIRHYVAKQLSTNSELMPNSLDFDISILRARNVERSTKELVKERLQRTVDLDSNNNNESFLKALRELSQGHVIKDKEWAIKLLTAIRVKGNEVPDLTIKKIKE